MPITPVPLPPLRSQGKQPAQYSAEFEAFMLAYYQSVIDYNQAASDFQLSVTATSSTSNTIGTGSRTFTVPSGLGFRTGMAVRAANTGAIFMTGEVSSYSGTTLVLNITSVSGSGTFTSWTISMAAVGANSAASISNAPSGFITSTNVQAAINELDGDKLSSAPGAVTSFNLENVITGGTAGSPTSVPVITYDAKGRITGMTAAQVSTLGVGQTWQDVTASRANSTNYTNSTGSPIFVSISGNLGAAVGAGQSIAFTVSGVIVSRFQPHGDGSRGGGWVGGIVPNGASYRVDSSNGNLNALWVELR